MSERKPTEADLPAWVYDIDGTLMRGPMLFLGHVPESWTHWRRAAADIPAPPREKTQEDKDDEGYDEWWTTKGANMSGGFRDAWHAALAYERAEVNKMLPDRPQIELGRGELVAVIEAIRARCGGGK